MKDNQDIEQYRQLLDQSSRDIPLSIKTQLDKKRHQAVEQLDTGHAFSFTKWQPVFALSIPMLIIAVIMYLPIPSQQQPTTDIYADLQLLMEEEQLDFLGEMEVSEWLVSENGG